MSKPNPLATAADVANERGVTVSADEISDRDLERATRAVEKRLPNETDEWLLKNLQILVTAHFLYPSMTGETEGKRVSRVSEGDATIAYETGDSGDIEGPGGYYSPFWAQAVQMDDRMDRDEAFSSHTL